MTLYPRRAESVGKSSMILQPRYPQTIVEPYTHYLVKDQSQPLLQTQPQPQPQPMQIVRRENFMPNNSMQIAPSHHLSQNYSSRIEMRPSSSEKMIKENLPVRTPAQLAQNFVESSFGVNAFDGSRKIKKSGLTIFKANENEQKTQ